MKASDSWEEGIFQKVSCIFTDFCTLKYAYIVGPTIMVHPSYFYAFVNNTLNILQNKVLFYPIFGLDKFFPATTLWYDVVSAS